jgi:hypothetical protein
MRLDSAQTTTGKRPFIRLSHLVCANRFVLVGIDTSPILLNAKEGLSGMLTGGRRRSAPELAGSTEVPTWIRKEMNDAEFISYNQLVSLLLYPTNNDF